MNTIPQPSAFAATRRGLALSVASLFAALVLTQSLSATPLYWDGNGITAGAGNTTALLNKIWGTDSMWNSDAAGVTNTFTSTTTSADDLFFVAGPSATSGNVAFNPTVTGTQAANSITFQNQGALTLSGGTAINLGAGGLVGAQFAYGSTARGAVTISSPIALQATQSWINNGTAAMTVSGAVSGTGDLTIQNTAAGTFAISTGGINNTGTITNSGSGGGTTTISGVVGAAVTGIIQNSATSQLILSGANTFTTGLTIKMGTVVANVSNATTVSGAAGPSTSAITLGSSTGGSASLLANSFTVSNAINLGTSSAGTLTLGNNAGATAAVFSGAIGLNGNNLTITSGGTGSTTVSGGITGTGNLTITNATTTATTTLSTTAINNAGTITNNGAGTGGTTISSALGVAVTNVTQNSATSALTLSGTNTNFNGTTTLTAGTLKLGSATALGGNGSTTGAGGALSIAAGTTLDASAATTITTVNVQNWNGDFTFGGSFGLNTGTGAVSLGANPGATRTVTVNGANTLTVGGVISNGTDLVTPTVNLTKAGSGTLSLTGANNYTGVTSVLSGTMSLTTAVASGSAGPLGNATSEVLVGDTSGSLATTLQTNIVSGVGIARNIRLQSGNTGTVTLNANAGGVGTGTISGNITLGSANGTGHGVTLIGGAGGNAPFQTATYTGIIQDPTGLLGAGGAVTLNGVGTVILSGTNTYTGGTFLNSGALTINNTQALGVGTLTITGGSINQSVASALVGVTSQTWGGNFTFSSGGGQNINLGTSAVTLTNSISITTNNVGATVGGVISGAGFGLTLRGTAFAGSVNLNGINTFSGGTTVAGGTANLTVNSGSASALGTGQLKLGNSTTSKVSLGVDTTVESLESGIALPSITGGTGYTNGTQNLIITGGGGTGATGTVTIGTNTSGVIASVNITNYGTGYTSTPTITLTTPGAGTGGALTSTFGSSSIALGTKTLTLSGGNASPATYVGIISGTGGNIVKKGSGSQTLAGGSIYTGTTTVSDGSLIAGTSSSSTTVAGSSVTADNTTDFITLSGNTLVNGDTVVFGATTIPTGLATGTVYYVVNQSGNTFQVSTTSGGSAVNFTSNGTTVTTSKAGAFGATTSAIVLGDAATTTNNSSPSLLTGGAIIIGRAVTISNQATSGTYTIGGNTANTSAFTGLVTTNKDLTVSQVTSGTLNVTGGIIGASAGTKIVKFNNAGVVNVTTTAISDGATGNVAVTQSGAGTTTLSAANSYTGGTIVSAGTLALSGSGTFGSGSLTVSGGTADLGTKSITNTLGALTGGAVNNGTITNSSGLYDLQNGSVGAILAGSNGLTKSTSGTVTLSSANTYTGTTTVSAGTLALGVASAISSSSNVSLDGGTLQSTFSQTLGTLALTTGSSTLDLSSGGTFAFADSSALAGSWSGSLSITGTFLDNSSVRFGTSIGGLTGGQLSQITINGMAASIDSSGYLFTAIPEPSTYAAILGALVLAGVVYRRRRTRSV